MSLNLLPSEAKFQAQKVRIKTIINNFLWVIGGGWVLLLLVTFGIFFFLNWRVRSLDNNYQSKLNNYKSKIEEVALTQKIKYQTKIVAKVLDSRFEYGKSMNLVNNAFPEGVRIDDIQIQDDKSFKINGGTTNGELMNLVEEIVSEMNTGQIEGFTGAKISDVDVNPTKGWIFTIDLYLK